MVKGAGEIMVEIEGTFINKSRISCKVSFDILSGNETYY